jgi:hypothetical protein
MGRALLLVLDPWLEGGEEVGAEIEPISLKSAAIWAAEYLVIQGDS